VAAALIRVAVVDDHPVVRDGTAALLATLPGIEVVGVASTVQEAVELIGATAIDVVLLDIRLGTDSGLRLLQTELRQPVPAIVVLSAYDYPQYADAALRLGAAGFVVKTAPLPELMDAITRAAAGGMAFHVRPQARAAHLSPRERDVVRLVVEGRTNDEIGTALSIGVRTVETHLRRVFERFEVGSRTELAARALREGWLEVPPG
jgi:Response regulator containing a CheY-like receiver domain and an HTH DNA-binding domain